MEDSSSILSQHLLRSLLPTPPTRIDISDLKAPLVENIHSNHASEFHKRLVMWITTFDETLDDQHEVGVRLVNFGQAIVFHLGNIGYCNPSLLFFSGNTDDGNPVELIQHVSQISILLMKLPRQNPEQPKRPFGFHLAQIEEYD